ncbi:MAG TPA: hypothetical protein VI520_06445 [Anaerolineales bacterium]|nr:hypothetical protein [Anaerolineales bacterium]
MLARLVGAELAEAILGDLQELRPTIEARWGKVVSWVWLSLEIARGAAVLTAQRLRAPRRREKEKRSMDNWNVKARRVAVVIGIVASLPAAVLVVGGLLQSDWGTPALQSTLERTLFNRDLVGFRILIHPATVFSGLLLAAGSNLLPLLRLKLERRPGTLVGMLSLRIRAAHLVVALFAVGLLGVILGYGFTENFKVVPTHVSVLESGWQYTAAPVRPVTTFDGYFLPGALRSLEGSRMLFFRLATDEGTWQAVPTPSPSGE